MLIEYHLKSYLFIGGISIDREISDTFKLELAVDLCAADIFVGQ